MDMPKLLIADSNEEFRQFLFETLSADYCVKTCRDGKQALELLRSFRPSLLVLDLVLPELDGISLLQRAMEEGMEPAVLVATTYQNPYVMSWLSRLETCYVVAKPCDLQAIADRIGDFAAALRPDRIPAVDLHNAISNLLLTMGFPTHLDGFLFLHSGIPLYMRDPGQAMTKELYVSIGAPHQKTSAQVERSIRSAIKTAWETGDPKLWHRYFGAPDGSVPRPSNNVFISRIATALREQGYGSKSA